MIQVFRTSQKKNSTNNHTTRSNLRKAMAVRMSNRANYSVGDRMTMWEVLERAAKTKFGYNIKVVKARWITKQVEDLSFIISVVKADPAPTEKSRTIADINMKEYFNPSDTSVDETTVRITKKNTRSLENRYQFSTTKGVSWGVGGNIGAQVMGLATAGGSASIGGSYGKQKSTTTENEQSQAHGFEIGYEQEEKICVQPHTKMKATITTYAMKYEQGYTIKLSLPKGVTLNLMYKNRCNQWCCGASLGRISASELLSELPGYSEEDDVVSFLQDGTLSWIGEGSKVEKSVEPLSVI